MNVLGSTLAVLTEAVERSEAVLVAYSGGKDSLVVLDLCKRSFRRVETFFMDLLPGLASVEAALAWASERDSACLPDFDHSTCARPCSRPAWAR